MEASEYKILLVDDEKDIIEFLSYNLAREGFKVFSANSGKEALKIARQQIPDIIVLDVMMPGMDGVETCEALRENEELKDSIIVFLTARADDYSQIAALDSGGDDFITKPIKPKVFISKIYSLLRRSKPAVSEIPKQMELKNLKIDAEKYLVEIGGKNIVLPRKEFELLFLLSTKPGKVFTREEIFTKIWGNDVIVGDRTIDVHVRKIREKVGDDVIKTIKGVGYKLEES